MEKRHLYSLKNIIKTAIGVLLIALIAVLAILAVNYKSLASSNGTITVVVKNIDNEIVSKKRIAYKKSDTLYELLCKEYEIDSLDTQYGHFVKGIKDNNFDIQTDGNNSWIWFELAYLNDEEEYSDDIDFNKYIEKSVTTGIDGIELVDNMILGINERDNNHNTTIFIDKININNSTINILKIIIITLSSIILLGILTYIIILIIKDIKNKENKLTIKDIALIAFLTALLFVQEELLTFLPNIQLTVFLIVLYSKMLGMKKTSIIVLIHVILDNLFMSSFSFIYTLPMLVGWLIIPISLNTIFKKANSSFSLALLAILFSFIYCWLFVLPSVCITGIAFKDYILADVLFEILLALSSFTSVWLLYEPCEKIFNKLLNNDNQIEE